MPSGQFRIRGEYEHMDQADFLLYSTDGGSDRIDTLHLLRGEFEYMAPLSSDATFRIHYPNDDELVIWAHRGDDITVRGDAQDLLNVKVGGNEENELYTKFRQELTEVEDTASVRRSAAMFIRKNPQSAVSVYLLERYFVLNRQTLPADSVKRLYQVIRKAQPHSNAAALLGGKIQRCFALEEGNAMSDFKLMLNDSLIHTLAEYRGHSLLLYFWAGWIGSVGGEHQLISDSLKADTTLRAISYSLDVDTTTFRITRGDTTLCVSTYCDYQGFQSPLAKQLGITSLPLAVWVDSAGIIRKVGKNVSDVFVREDDEVARKPKRITKQNKK